MSPRCPTPSASASVSLIAFGTESTRKKKEEERKKKKHRGGKKWACSADNTIPGSHFLSTPQLALGMGLHLPRVHFFTGGCGHPWAKQTA
ncbi:hypothetical protein KOW79_005738 [Hemibagrus wyckioides]|uniref:Uncharacterized protein n=1 Tax=Hemibagrus wyckioides TaxID=337641 RepID=A0A9D3P0Z6_9TELE|nr:hypothetical protein KOW79_005738 [Hemibagrus wyckioides]